MANGKRGTVKAKKPEAKEYRHSEAESPMRPEIGTQTRFKKKLPPAKFRYDDSLAPVMEWDGQNAARDKGEWLLGLIEEAASQPGTADAAKGLPAPHQFVPARELKNSRGEVVATVTGLRDAVAQLKAIGKPFLNWSGKAERTSFDVPSLPLFIHERLSTKAILDTLTQHMCLRTWERYRTSHRQCRSSRINSPCEGSLCQIAAGGRPQIAKSATCA
jgi:adenine-specific DNA-methyltransferase